MLHIPDECFEHEENRCIDRAVHLIEDIKSQIGKLTDVSLNKYASVRLDEINKLSKDFFLLISKEEFWEKVNNIIK